MDDTNGINERHPSKDAVADETSEAGWLQAMELGSLCSIFMAAKAAVNLNVFDILAKANSALSAQEIVAGIATSNPQAPISLDRILRLLASHSILGSSVETSVHGETVRKYYPTPVSHYLAHRNKDGSLASFLLFNSSMKAIADVWGRLHESVLYSGDHFKRVTGKNIFRHLEEDDPEVQSVFMTAMTNHSIRVCQRLLEVYDGFKGLNTLVDVGGGSGVCLSMIVAKHPHIRGINFDLPQVIESCPAYPGVQHVGGNMFEAVPPADAVFMKYILHDWEDDLCIQLLKNCHRGLRENGKVIVVDVLLSTVIKTGLRDRVGYEMDVLMLAYTSGGKERTEEEFKYLITAAGFQGMKVVCTAHEMSVIELYK